MPSEGTLSSGKSSENLVIISSEFGMGKKYHKPKRKGGGVPCCQDMFPRGTYLVLKGDAKMDGYKPCQHPACFGDEGGSADG